MTRHSWHTLKVIKRAATFRLRQLWAELSMLMGFFPDLRDAFDPDELPLDFILKRDSQTDPSATRMTPLPARACATSRRRWHRPSTVAVDQPSGFRMNESRGREQSDGSPCHLSVLSSSDR